MGMYKQSNLVIGPMRTRVEWKRKPEKTVKSKLQTAHSVHQCLSSFTALLDGMRTIQAGRRSSTGLALKTKNDMFLFQTFVLLFIYF